jgi:hypothetical protein
MYSTRHVLGARPSEPAAGIAGTTSRQLFKVPLINRFAGPDLELVILQPTTGLRESSASPRPNLLGGHQLARTTHRSSVRVTLGLNHIPKVDDAGAQRPQSHLNLLVAE